MFSFGIEHEVAFVNCAGNFADFSCTKFSDFDQIVQELPKYPSDYPQLRVGDALIKDKRWYIEGFERFLDSEEVLECVPKGIEIRTTINSSIEDAINELSESFDLLCKVALKFGFSPVLTSFNPYHSVFQPEPPLNEYEINRRRASPEKQTANIPMLTYGPDLNISATNLSVEEVIDIGKKLTYYSPYIIPFSYSSPFYEGEIWDGLSIRTFVRTGQRPATMVFVGNKEEIIESSPSLTKIARIPAEVGRIEFKACDSCGDFSIYAGILALLKGLVLDKSLSGRAIIPDPKLHQLSAQFGFDDQKIYENAYEVLNAAQIALVDDSDAKFLEPLKHYLEKRKTPAHDLINLFNYEKSIQEAMKGLYKNK